MMPTSEVAEGTPLSIAEFYDALAPDYDTMTGFQKRFIQEKPFFRLLIDKYKIDSALDAGCGTGFHSLLLAQLEVDVTAVDISSAMTQAVQRHAKEFNVNVKVVRGAFGDLGSMMGAQFDAVFSMGNSTTHLLTEEGRRAAFDGFASVLRPQGILFIQNLNYDRILAKKERIQSVKEVGGTTFVRFYDYGEDLLSFNILKIERTEAGVQQTLRTIQLKPLLSGELVSLLTHSGFADIKQFGGISMDEYRPETSKDLVVLARKQVV